MRDPNKVDVIAFLLHDWSNNKEYSNLQHNRKLYLNFGNHFYEIKTQNNEIVSEEVFELQTTQEEADTKVFLCCQHAARSGHRSTCIVDSDNPLYALYFTDKILIDIYVLIGTKKKKDC